jgi:transposase
MSNNKESESQRRQFSPEQKIKILRQHLLDKVPISEVCERHQITPTQFYQWQKTFFENGAAAFARPNVRASNREEQRLAKLEAKLQRKDEVIAEIMAEHILLEGVTSFDQRRCGKLGEFAEFRFGALNPRNSIRLAVVPVRTAWIVRLPGRAAARGRATIRQHRPATLYTTSTSDC